MKRGRRAFFLLLACGVVAVVAALVWPREREPVYKGKRLSMWLEGFRMADGRFCTGGEAEAAVRHIGTNGLPFLVKWIGYERSGSRGRLAHYARSLPGVVRGSSLVRWLDGERAEARATEATLGLSMLGTRARAAIPELRRMENGSAREASGRATVALRAIAPEMFLWREDGPGKMGMH